MDNLISVFSGHFKNFLSGSDISKTFSYWAAQYDINIPYSDHPFKNFTSKQTAIQDNLLSFEEEQQFIIIKRLCEERLKEHSNDQKTKEILKLLIQKFGNEYQDDDDSIDRDVINETQTWLLPYPDARYEYMKALEAYEIKEYNRNTLDSMRLSLELLVKQIIGNNKSLENQNLQKDLLPLLKEKGIPKEIRNLICNIFSGLEKYQNERVKHGITNTSLEFEFVIEQTSILMKLITKALKS